MRTARSNLPVTIVLLLGSLLILYPLALALIVSLKSTQDIAASALSLPTRIHFDNFVGVFEEVNYLSALKNSLLITGLSVMLVVSTSSMVGYAIGRNMHRRAFKVMYFYFISGMFIPFTIIMMPLIKMLNYAHLDNFTGIVLGYVFFNLPPHVFLTVGYLRSVPADLEESATIDGAGALYTFWKIVFPLLKPINATIAVFTMLGVWNDFLLPSLLIRDPNWMTLPMIQYVFQGQFMSDYGLAFASYLMAILPSILFYLFAQKWIVSGLTTGAMKS